MTATEARFVQRLSQPIPGASLAVFRIAFGLLMAMGLIRFWTKGWIEAYYLTPSYHFSYTGLEWIRPWPGIGMYVHVAILIVCALLVAAGKWHRPAMALFALGFAWLELIDKTPYLNHYYAIACFALLMSLMPLDRCGSLSASWQAKLPAWCLYTLRAQTAIIYVYAGLAKLQPDWLLRAEPLRTWLAAWSQLPLIGPWLAMPATAWAMSWAGFLFDLTIPLWLSLSRTRPWAYAAAVIFHILTALLFPIGLFPWVMLLLAMLFFPPDWPLRFIKRHAALETPRQAYRLPRPLLLLLALWFGLQLLLPLRHHLYGPGLLWHEQGFRFAWQVMVMEKTGMVEYRLSDPVSGREWRVNPRARLTPFQLKMLSTQPDMIQQFAHELGRQWRAKGYPAVEVRAEAWAALNGRPSQRLIDPDLDLLQAPLSGWRPKAFILPLQDKTSARE